MTHWIEFTKQRLSEVPPAILGVFQLSRDGETVHCVGRSDEDLHAELSKFLDSGYRFFQWQKLPWAKEAYEMQCRLFHHAGGAGKLDNSEHPFPPEGHAWACRMSYKPAAVCDL
ncbi:MAG: hypothetical protein HUU37_09445 [Bdellovibrionales bacterium]|nr:hypothetical protein [Bdellovibrionales bacterium]